MLSAVSAKLLERSGQLADGQDQYRPGVGIVLLNDEGQVFVGHRNASSQNPWQLPQGGIQKGESAHEAALRELMEELGTNNVEVIAESNGWFSYDVPEANAVEAWSGRWKGQRQKWFVMAFKGRNEDFDLTCGDAEFKVWRWVSIHDLPMLAVPFKRALYQDIVKEFAAIVSGRTT
ncbi:MAG: RNA pyrophosphohydrolase [Proteobacteria bacterium]|nr:RNA pyrophosphohydrolase [Pseudomonadota bacterium]